MSIEDNLLLYWRVSLAWQGKDPNHSYTVGDAIDILRTVKEEVGQYPNVARRVNNLLRAIVKQQDDAAPDRADVETGDGNA